MNQSYSSFTSELTGPGYLVFSFVFLLLVLLPTVAVNVFIVVFIAVDKTTAKHMRLVLGNIPVACIIVALGLSLYHTTGMYLNISKGTPPTVVFCNFIFFLIAFGGVARLLSMATFAAMIFTTVRYYESTPRKNLVIFITIVIILWICAFLGTTPLLSDEVLYTSYGDNVSCSPIPAGVGSYVYVSLYCFVFGICTFVVTIVLLTLTVCYIRRNSIRANTLNKAMLKLGVFLLIGNSINIIGQVVPPLIATIVVPVEETETGNFGRPQPATIYFAYAMLNLSLVPPPVLIFVYFKPIAVWCIGKPLSFCCNPRGRVKKILQK